MTLVAEICNWAESHSAWMSDTVRRLAATDNRDLPEHLSPFVAMNLGLSTVWSRSGRQRLRGALSSFKPDVVHAWNIHQHLSYASLVLARKRGVPVVMTLQDAQPFCYTKFNCYIDRTGPCPAARHDGPR